MYSMRAMTYCSLFLYLVTKGNHMLMLSDNGFINIFKKLKKNLIFDISFRTQKFIISCMNKMEQLFQEQRRNLLNMMMLAKQSGLPPSVNKVESMKQPLKEQNKQQQQQPKRNQEVTMNKKKKQKSSSSHVEDVNF